MKTSQKFNIDFDYNELHHDAPKAVQAPLIGLTGNFSDNKLSLLPGYYTSILKAGAVPVILPPTEDADILISFLNRIDGLLLPEEQISIPSSFKKNPSGNYKTSTRIVTGRNCCWHVWPPTGKFPYWAFAEEYRF